MVVDNEVGAGDEVQEFVAAAIHPEVHNGAALSAVQEPEPGGVPTHGDRRPRGAPTAEGVTGRRLHLAHVGAGISEQLADIGSGHPAAHLEHPDPGQRMLWAIH